MEDIISRMKGIPNYLVKTNFYIIMFAAALPILMLSFIEFTILLISNDYTPILATNLTATLIYLVVWFVLTLLMRNYLASKR